MAKRRIGFMAIASWTLATLITSLVVWRAVAVLDSGTRTEVLSGAQVSGLLASETATPAPSTSSRVTIPPATVPATSTTAEPTTAPVTTAPTTAAPTKASATTTKPAPPAASPVARTWTVTGGVVSASCTGATISLLYATPSDGWRVKIEKRGPETISLEFVNGEKETKVHGVCSAGVPQQTSEDHD